MTKSHYKIKKINNSHYWELIAGNGTSLFKSDEYKTKCTLLKSIEKFKRECHNAEKYSRKERDNGMLYFTFRLGTKTCASYDYSISASLENGIQAVIRNGATSWIKEK